MLLEPMREMDAGGACRNMPCVQSAKSQRAQQPVGVNMGCECSVVRGARVCAEACTCQPASNLTQQHKARKRTGALHVPSLCLFSHDDKLVLGLTWLERLISALFLTTEQAPQVKRERCIIDAELLGCKQEQGPEASPTSERGMHGGRCRPKTVHEALCCC